MKESPYLLMLMKLWPGDWEDHPNRMNNKVDEENGIEGTQENGRFRKLWWFSRNKFWKSIGCLLAEPIFGLGGLRLWYKNMEISEKKRKKSSIRPKVDLYEVCASLFQIIYYYYFYTNTSFPSTKCLASLTLGEKRFRNY